MTRWGVIGAGWFASRRHLPELVAHPEVDLVALCRRQPEPLAQLAAHFGVAQTYTDVEAMLSQAELDAVLVCSPHNLHFRHTAAALQAGCHVLLEKPMTVHTADAVALVGLAERSGKLLEVAYNPPYWRQTVYLRERLAAGDLGTIETVDLRWTGDIRGVFGRSPLPARLPGLVPPSLFRGDIEANGGGHLIDGGSHQICEAMWVTGQEFTTVSAQMDSVPDDLRFQVNFALSGGGFGSVVSIGDSPCPDRRSVSLYLGTAGTAVLRGMPFELTLLRPGHDPERIPESAMPEPPQPVVALQDAIAGRSPQRCPGASCVRYVAAIAAAYEAAATGQTKALGG
ncbi:MAG: Gfo/Idh/MocA family oxidoreductase [Fimbriimonadaceae bacterium]|nr:Gfo/Idh/MocA family oxidoreductase [Fimbriimonadaceae bacterium]